jgi:hypothetical protein
MVAAAAQATVDPDATVHPGATVDPIAWTIGGGAQAV